MLHETIDQSSLITDCKSYTTLYSRDYKSSNTIISFENGAKIGGNDFSIIAGPCAIESFEQAFESAEILVKNGIKIMRGGVFKPRTSPYSFQGLGKEAVSILKFIKDKFNLTIVTEVLDKDTLEIVKECADILQIGSRNMHNYSLLKLAGGTGKPILLKRGMSATLKEFLLAAEYILNTGNNQVILCERGIRTFETSTRNTLDISAIPVLKNLTHLPIIVDPSHACGDRNIVSDLVKAILAVGSHGTMIEVHPYPEKALSDGIQSLYPEQFYNLMKELKYLEKSIKYNQSSLNF